VNDLDLTVDLGSPCSAGIGRYVGNDPMTVISEAHGEESPLRGCTGGTRDIFNNVEIVRFFVGTGTVFTVNVAGYNAVGLSGPLNQKFALVIQNAYDSTASPPPATPANLLASAASNQVNLSWNASPGQGITYEVRRKSGSAPQFSTIRSDLTSPNLSDTNLAQDVYVYEVRAKNTTGFSDYSNPDAASTLPFTDDPLAAGETVIRKAHVDEIRAGANALRAAAGLTAYSFTDSTITSGVTLIQVAHINELRGAMESAQDLLGLPRVQYSHPLLTPGTSVVSAVDVQELRNALK
jgi:hypothetical protein